MAHMIETTCKECGKVFQARVKNTKRCLSCRRRKQIREGTRCGICKERKTRGVDCDICRPHGQIRPTFAVLRYQEEGR